MRKLALACCAIAMVLIANQASANPGYGSHGHNHVVVAPPLLATPIPIYGAAYTGSESETTRALEAILAELKAMREELSALRSSGAPVGALALQSGKDPVATVKASCASCHTEGKSPGGGFEMFDLKGNPLKLNGPDKREIDKRVRQGTMPPPDKKKLAQDEKLAIAKFLEIQATPIPPAKK